MTKVVRWKDLQGQAEQLFGERLKQMEMRMRMLEARISRMEAHGVVLTENITPLEELNAGQSSGEENSGGGLGEGGSDSQVGGSGEGISSDKERSEERPKTPKKAKKKTTGSVKK